MKTKPPRTFDALAASKMSTPRCMLPTQRMSHVGPHTALNGVTYLRQPSTTQRSTAQCIHIKERSVYDKQHGGLWSPLH